MDLDKNRTKEINLYQNTLHVVKLETEGTA